MQINYGRCSMYMYWSLLKLPSTQIRTTMLKCWRPVSHNLTQQQDFLRSVSVKDHNIEIDLSLVQ